MNDRLLSLMGLCRRAGKLTVGNDVVTEAVTNGEASLVLTASDVSPNTLKKLVRTCESCGVDCIRLSRTKEELSLAIGRFAAVTAVCDEGFARKLRELSQN